MHLLKIYLIYLTHLTLRPSFCLSYGGDSSGSEANIPIGLISDDTTENIRKTFDYAISIANMDLSIPLVGYHEQVDYGNSLDAFGKLCKLMQVGIIQEYNPKYYLYCFAFGKLCKLMQNGIGGIFGPAAKHTAAHLLNVCDAKDIPFIYPHLTVNVLSEGFNLYPHPVDIARSLHAIIEQFEWSRFVFLYESSDYLGILDNLMTMYGMGGPVINVLRYDLNLNGNYKSVLRRVRKSVDSRIVVVGSTESVAALLRQAQQVGIMNEDYTYIIGNLDFHTFQLEEYKYSEVNITGIRMFSPEQDEVRNLIIELGFYEYETELIQNGSCPITLEMALTYDAVRVFAETTKFLNYVAQPLNCSEKHDNVQTDGSTFKNYMRSLDLTENSLTGRIFFEGNIRKGYAFDVIELQPTGLVKVGTWEEGKNFTFERPPQAIDLSEIDENSLVNKTFKVLISVPNKPYASLVESHQKLIGNNQYEGYGIDLIKELAEKLGFNFTFHNGGNDYGSFNKSTNMTTGMLKEIVEGHYDLAITDLTITSEREEAIDFSIPFMNLGIAILYRKPQKAEPELFSFMDPFSKEVWVYLGLAYIGVSLCFFVMGRLSPTEWDNPYPCIEEPDELENQFTINNSVWFTTGALLQQGSEIAPKALSTRTIASIWWFFTLIIVSSYTANLAAFLTYENPTGLIDNVQDLAKNKSGVQYGAKRTGSTRNFFLNSDDETYKEMNTYLTNNPHLLTETNQEGVDKVKEGTMYAFLMESTSIEYNTVRECNLKKIGDALDEKGYGIAMVKNWPHRDKFNNALLELQEQGVLGRLKNKWWNEVGAGVCDSDEGAGATAELTLDNLGGIYFVLIVGTCASIFYALATWCFFVFKKARCYEVPFCAALREEFIIAITFSDNERILKSAQSVYSHSRNSSQSIDSFETDSNDDDLREEE